MAGEGFYITLDTRLSLNQPDPPVGVNGVTIQIPNPPIYYWEFSLYGGTFRPDRAHSDATGLTLELKANADVTTATMVLPRLHLSAAIPADAAGQTLAFPMPSKMAFDLKQTPAPAISTCTGGGTLLTTKVVAKPAGTVPPGTMPPPPDPGDTLPVHLTSTSTTTPPTKPATGVAPAAPVPGTPHYAG